jgi:DtxR family Mn-dependent transcriptional regulator
MSSGLLLITGVLALGGLAWIFWPGRGLISLVTRMRMNTLKVQMEDALKFLFDCEYKNLPCSLHTIAGNLNISSNKVAAIIDRLQDMGLIAGQGESFQLTDTGKSYALRIIRVHRIWEKYLADETGVDHKQWHGDADLKEHLLSSEAAEKLAGQIGNPVFDPHGDPIPSASGDLPLHKGKNLSALNEGDTGRIVHIEDEPGYIYEQLIALGLYPGMQVYVMNVSGGKIAFAAEGDEHILTSLFASAITVEVLPESKPLNQKHALLSSLEVGDKAEIVGILPHCRGQQRRRLLDLGVVPGTLVTAEIKSASGDPVGYRIMGATIGIRKKQADYILINKNIS